MTHIWGLSYITLCLWVTLPWAERPKKALEKKWQRHTHTHMYTVKAAFVSGVLWWRSVLQEVCVWSQYLAVCKSSFIGHLALHWSIWQAFTTAIGIYIGAVWQQKKLKSMIVMLNLVLIDVICIVSLTVYGSTCVMWDCTYVLLPVVWINHSSFRTSDVLVNVNPFDFKRDFVKTWAPQNNIFFNTHIHTQTLCNSVWSSSLFTYLIVDQFKHSECSPLCLERECRIVFCGVHVFHFKALYVCLFS